MSLWIVRHGRTQANRSGVLLGRADPSLDEVGREQAAAIVAALPTPDVLVSSPLARTRETAEAFGQDVVADERFIEVDYGDYDLMPLSKVPTPVWDRWRSELDFVPPNGESMGAMFKRVSAGLSELQDTAADAEVVVVSHVSPIKASLCWALGVDASAMWHTRIDQASVTRIDIVRQQRSLRRFNDVSHLER